jgi:hypothetical protein
MQAKKFVHFHAEGAHLQSFELCVPAWFDVGTQQPTAIGVNALSGRISIALDDCVVCHAEAFPVGFALNHQR